MATSNDLDTIIRALASRLSEAVVAGMNTAIARASAESSAPTAKKGPGRPPKSAAASASVSTPASPTKRGPGRPPKVGGKGCLVSGCGKKTIAKGLCAGHYRKANRLGVANKLDKANLAKLAKDGRATRWAKK